MLERCKRTHPEYQAIRDRHYVPNKGCHGQQLHYLVKLDGTTVGIISAGSSVWAVKCRDAFFGITKENRQAGLPSIINNVVFRLETHVPNLATRVLSLWRKTVTHDWEERYNVRVFGFETFVVENDTRKGALYKADNWTFLGMTAGSTKNHKGLDTPHTRTKTCPKMVYGLKIRGRTLSTSYTSTWRKKKKATMDECALPAWRDAVEPDDPFQNGWVDSQGRP